MPLNEFEIIEKYFTNSWTNNSSVVIGPGDDCAVLATPPGKEFCFSTDTLNEGVHFLDQSPPDVVASRTVACNLSDIAAMGGDPYGCLLAITLTEVKEPWLRDFSKKLFLLLENYDCPLVGGNISKGAALSLTMTVIGSVPRGKAITRSGARVGDGIYVTGELGDSIKGLELVKSGETDNYLAARYCYPVPRIEEGKALRGIASSMIDISDGLLSDLGHLCTASGLGAEIRLDSLPLSTDLKEICGEDSAIGFALGQSDDYELCFTISKECEEKINYLRNSDLVSVTKIGEMIEEQKLLGLSGDGEYIELQSTGYMHF